MFKIKIRKFFKELFCPHKNIKTRILSVAHQSFAIIECRDCGKSWARE